MNSIPSCNVVRSLYSSLYNKYICSTENYLRFPFQIDRKLKPSLVSSLAMHKKCKQKIEKLEPWGHLVGSRASVTIQWGRVRTASSIFELVDSADVFTPNLKHLQRYISLMSKIGEKDWIIYLKNKYKKEALGNNITITRA